MLPPACRWLHAGTLVKVVLKWLWRLADDENCSYEVPLPLRAQLLDGLRGVSGLEEPQVGCRAAAGQLQGGAVQA